VQGVGGKRKKGEKTEAEDAHGGFGLMAVRFDLYTIYPRFGV